MAEWYLGSETLWGLSPLGEIQNGGLNVCVAGEKIKNYLSLSPILSFFQVS